MKKLFTYMLAGLLLFTAGCGPDGQPLKEEEIMEMISENLAFVDVWEDEEDANLKFIFTAGSENECSMIGYWGKTASEAENWTLHGTWDPDSGRLVYEDGSYAKIRMTPEGKEVREKETKTAGSFEKSGDDVLIWNDSMVSGSRTLKKKKEGDSETQTDGGSGSESAEGPRVALEDGPFTVTRQFRAALSEDERTRFEKGVDGQIAVGFTPVQVLAQQTVNGTNYAYLAYADYELNVHQESYVILVINENSAGETELLTTGVLDVNDPKLLESTASDASFGAWTIVNNDADGEITEEVNDAFAKAAENAESPVSHPVPVALLGTAEANGTVTYRILVRGSTEEIDPGKSLYVYDIQKTADGTCSVVSLRTLDLKAYTFAENESE